MSPKAMNESSANIEALMSKLRSPSYYYTKPTIEELAAKERAEPGYIGRVKDFEVGRQGIGSIRFLGEIDLRGVDLECFFKIVRGKVTAPQAFNDTSEMTLVTEKYTPKELECCDIQALVRWKLRRFKKEVEDLV